ncbi:vomeronasal type-1 receptor 4-like [Trichosurus vulpecula]|uniref:vomeronasal type-1 receptor 4-like n=1 Tax=Trichosurus vulpecula TaxID=9337 RepID=UPI00186B0F31|nr:vomeronasal type-1 receptor 4-like [Trichosurus vulpecula]
MISHNEVLGIVYLILIVLGIVGNSVLLYLYGHKSITGHKTRPINMIVIHMAFSNSMLIVFGGVPKIMQVWVLKSFLDCNEVKILNYLMRAARGLSLCTSCLLSVSQAITISPYSPMWAGVKARAPKCTLPCCLLCWVLNLLTAIFIPIYVTCPRNSSKERWNIWSSSLNLHAINTIKIAIWKSVYDGVFVGLMAVTSGYMVLVLCRHHQRVQHIRRPNMAPRASPETRATKAILLLMIFFVCFTSVSSPFSVHMAYSEETKHWVINGIIILSLCYPTVSPFILISSDTHITWACHGL